MIQATYFDGASSQANSVEVQFERNSITLIGAAENLAFPMSAVKVTAQLGQTGRSIHLPGGGRVDLPDVPQLDQYTARDLFFLSNYIERRWTMVLASIVLIVGITWTAITVGVPVMARYVASISPASLDESIGYQGLALLDRTFLQPSQLDRERQAQILDLFEQIDVYADDPHQFQLVFRAGGLIGANALALPSGIVILTDELVELSEHDEELVGVLAHEVGHVVHRHSMRLLLQSSATAMLIAAFAGDLTSLSVLAASIPTVLVQNSYSRSFEREADQYAYEYLDYRQIPTQRLADILARLELASGGAPDGAMSYLSTHPAAAERTEDIRE